MKRETEKREKDMERERDTDINEGSTIYRLIYFWVKTSLFYGLILLNILSNFTLS